MKYILWFINLDISNDSKIALIEKYNNEESIYNNIEEIIKSGLLKGKEWVRIKESNFNDCNKLLDYLNINGIGFITYTSINYPEKLKSIINPPYVLFYKGDLSLMSSKTVAVVGSRKCTVYGEEVTKLISKELCEMDYTIISGVAYGIDTVAHKETLLRDGKTIGVLGCGIDIIYPKINKSLYYKIASKGLLLTEFLPGTEPFSYNFPRRNRIISGLSKYVIVVEATAKSGSLITVNYALNQGKEIMAVPGSVMNSVSKGCNQLIRDGAKPFTEIEDLYDFLNETKSNVEKKVKNSMKEALKRIIGDQPIHLDKIMESVNVDRIALFELLFEMQNNNEIICLPGNYYAKIS